MNIHSCNISTIGIGELDINTYKDRSTALLNRNMLDEFIQCKIENTDLENVANIVICIGLYMLLGCTAKDRKISYDKMYKLLKKNGIIIHQVVDLAVTYIKIMSKNELRLHIDNCVGLALDEGENCTHGKILHTHDEKTVIEYHRKHFSLGN